MNMYDTLIEEALKTFDNENKRLYDDCVQRLMDVVGAIITDEQEHLDNGIVQTEELRIPDQTIALTVEQACSVLQLSKPIVYELIKDEGFPSFRVGKSIRINRQGLQEWINRQSA